MGKEGEHQLSRPPHSRGAPKIWCATGKALPLAHRFSCVTPIYLWRKKMAVRHGYFFTYKHFPTSATSVSCAPSLSFSSCSITVGAVPLLPELNGRHGHGCWLLHAHVLLRLLLCSPTSTHFPPCNLDLSNAHRNQQLYYMSSPSMFAPEPEVWTLLSKNLVNAGALLHVLLDPNSITNPSPAQRLRSFSVPVPAQVRILDSPLFLFLFLLFYYLQICLNSYLLIGSFNWNVYYMKFYQKNVRNMNLPFMLMFTSCSLHFSYV